MDKIEDERMINTLIWLTIKLYLAKLSKKVVNLARYSKNKYQFSNNQTKLASIFQMSIDMTEVKRNAIGIINA